MLTEVRDTGGGTRCVCTSGGGRDDGVGLANFQEAVGFSSSPGKFFSQPLEI